MTDVPTTKHSGCADCGSKSDAILTSVMDPTKHLQSKAVCAACLPNYPEGRR